MRVKVTSQAVLDEYEQLNRELEYLTFCEFMEEVLALKPLKIYLVYDTIDGRRWIYFHGKLESKKPIYQLERKYGASVSFRMVCEGESKFINGVEVILSSDCDEIERRWYDKF